MTVFTLKLNNHTTVVKEVISWIILIFDSTDTNNSKVLHYYFLASNTVIMYKTNFFMGKTISPFVNDLVISLQAKWFCKYFVAVIRLQVLDGIMLGLVYQLSMFNINRFNSISWSVSTTLFTIWVMYIIVSAHNVLLS